MLAFLLRGLEVATQLVEVAGTRVERILLRGAGFRVTRREGGLADPASFRSRLAIGALLQLGDLGLDRARAIGLLLAGALQCRQLLARRF